MIRSANCTIENDVFTNLKKKLQEKIYTKKNLILFSITILITNKLK